jgi:hypothetical protein
VAVSMPSIITRCYTRKAFQLKQVQPAIRF